MYLCSYQVKLHLNHVYMSDFEYKRIHEYYYDDFKFEDNKIKIKIKKNYDINIEILSGNRKEADLIAHNCFRKICKTLSILIQLQNDNQGIISTLVYFPSSLKSRYEKVKESNENKYLYNETINFKDCPAINAKQYLNFEQFDKIYDNFNNKSEINIGEIIYRATLEPNIESRFFKLFSIIENIENRYLKSEDNLNINEKILNKNQANELIKIISQTINKFHLDEICEKTLLDGLTQTIRSRTKFNRANKLKSIINEKFGIYNIDKYRIKFKVDENKMKEFINTRNSLFHGGANSKKLNSLTNELQELCLKIFERDPHLIIDHK